MSALADALEEVICLMSDVQASLRKGYTYDVEIFPNPSFMDEPQTVDWAVRIMRRVRKNPKLKTQSDDDYADLHLYNSNLVTEHIVTLLKRLDYLETAEGIIITPQPQETEKPDESDDEKLLAAARE